MKLIHFILGVGLVLALYPVAHADDTDRLTQLTQLYNATRAVCGGISDELQHLKNMTTGNTVVSGVGTAAGDAFYKKYPGGVFFIKLVVVCGRNASCKIDILLTTLRIMLECLYNKL